MATEMTLRQVRYLLAAVDETTMAGAARTLHVSASAVSLAITDLEAVLGTQLLIRRHHQPLALTRSGQDLIGDLRRLAADASDISVAAERIGNRPAGRLSVGCFRTLAPIHVPPLVSRMKRVHPEIELTVTEAPLRDLQADLLAGTIEAAVMYDLDVLPEIETEVLLDTKPHIIVGAQHRFADRRRVRLADLADEPMVMLDVHPSEVYFRSLLDGFGIEPHVDRVTGSFETLRSLVARGVGWALLIGRPLIDVSYEGLPISTIEIADPVDPMPVVLAWPRDTRFTRRADAFRSVCLDVIGSPPVATT